MDSLAQSIVITMMNKSNRSTQDQQACDRCKLNFICSETSRESPIAIRQHGLKRKERLFSSNDAFTSIYAIHSGAMKTFHLDFSGQERIHQFYLPGEMLGFEAVYLNYYPLSAVAMVNTKVCQIPYERLLQFVFSRPEWHRKIISMISQRFNFGQYIASLTAEQRIASFLLEMSQRLFVDGESVEFELVMSRQDIGYYLGLATETVSRVFTRFKLANFIAINNKKITLLEIDNDCDRNNFLL